MTSFTEYIKSNFYNALYEAGEDYFLEHLDELNITLGYDEEEVEVYDVEIEYVYAGNRGDGFINIDVLLNVYASIRYANNHDEIEETRNRWLRLSCKGKPEAGIKNFEIIEISSYQKGSYSVFQQPLSEQLVPIICKDDLDKVAEYFLRKYHPRVLEVPMAVNPKYIIQKLGLNLIFESITPDTSVFGQMYFYENKEKKISSGTIVIDENLANVRNQGVVNNTMIHECVHWEFHKYAIELERAFQKDLSVLSTTTIQNRTDGNRAVDWMEWHAETLAPKILMPKAMFLQETNARYKRLIEHCSTRDKLDVIELLIDELAQFFGVSRLSAKVRLAELGFEEAQGAFIYIDGSYVPTHTWKQGALAESQTFSVSLIDMGLQLYSHSRLKERVDKGELIFVESHLCLNDGKYIQYDLSGQPFLTTYARHHMDECCAIFDICYKNRTSGYPSLALLLNRGADSDIQFSISYPEDANDLLEQTIVHIDDVMNIMKDLPADFGGALKGLMKWRDVTNQELSDLTNLGLEAISKMRNNKTEPTLESVIAICVALKLPPVLSRYLIELSGRSLRTNNQKEMLYEIILSSTASWTVAKCNDLLVKNNYKELVADKNK